MANWRYSESDLEPGPDVAWKYFYNPKTGVPWKQEQEAHESAMADAASQRAWRTSDARQKEALAAEQERETADAARASEIAMNFYGPNYDDGPDGSPYKGSELDRLSALERAYGSAGLGEQAAGIRAEVDKMRQTIIKENEEERAANTASRKSTYSVLRTASDMFSDQGGAAGVRALVEGVQYLASTPDKNDDWGGDLQEEIFAAGIPPEVLEKINAGTLSRQEEAQFAPAFQKIAELARRSAGFYHAEGKLRQELIEEAHKEAEAEKLRGEVGGDDVAYRAHIEKPSNHRENMEAAILNTFPDVAMSSVLASQLDAEGKPVSQKLRILSNESRRLRRMIDSFVFKLRAGPQEVAYAFEDFTVYRPPAEGQSWWDKIRGGEEPTSPGPELFVIPGYGLMKTNDGRVVASPTEDAVLVGHPRTGEPVPISPEMIRATMDKTGVGAEQAYGLIVQVANKNKNKRTGPPAKQTSSPPGQTGGIDPFKAYAVRETTPPPREKPKLLRPYEPPERGGIGGAASKKWTSDEGSRGRVSQQLKAGKRAEEKRIKNLTETARKFINKGMLPPSHVIAKLKDANGANLTYQEWQLIQDSL